MELSQIYIYPIKSMGGIRVGECELDRFGLKYDRRWMIVNEHGQFLSQRQHAQMCLFEVKLIDDGLIITHKTNKEVEIIVPFKPNSNQIIKAKVWDDECKAQIVDDSIDLQLSKLFGEEVHLVLMPDTSTRQVDRRYAPEGTVTAFSDGYPLLIISEESLDLLNSKLDHPIEINRFRPNLVIKGGTPHCEDQIGKWRIAQVEFEAVKPCSRCVVTTINPDSAQKSPEPLKTLASYRIQNDKVMFGMNFLHLNANSNLKLGDKVEFLA